MSFEHDIDDLVKRLIRREIDPPLAAEAMVSRVRDELGARATKTAISGLERYIEAACHRHFGGDCDDQSIQTFLSRQVKRLGFGRLAPPQEDGEIIWI